MVEAEAERAESIPRVFTRIHFKYSVAGRGLDAGQVERAVKLSKDKYCSATQMLGACGITNFVAVDVLQDQEIRQGIKEYANWPTIPQLYVNGEFIGGSDILMEMYQAGELQQVLGKAA